MANPFVPGSIVALVTPLHEDGSVNFEELGRLLDFQISHKTDGILILGTTGESTTLTHEEYEAILDYTVKHVDHRVPVIAGTGSNCTETMRQKSLLAQEKGVDGLLLITPYYNKTNEEGMYLHFKTVADAVDIPCCLYNVPGRTGCSISEANVARLAKHPNIVAIKEASGNMSYAMTIARHLSDDFVMYSGNDDLITPMMAAGSVGVISVLANIVPEQTHNIVANFLDGKVSESIAEQLRLLDVANHLFIEVNPVPVKAALNLMGFDVGGYRLPLTDMTTEHLNQLRVAMQKAGLL